MKGHAGSHFDKELERLHKSILKMGGMVEEMISGSVKALVERDSELAMRMIDFDHRVNAMEVEIDEQCIRLLALYQPAAKDLRFITTGLKIVTDLERISDLGVNICERVVELNTEPQLKPYIDLPKMAEAAQRMVKESLEAFVKGDTDLAIRVCGDDSLVDDLNAQIFRELLTYMLEDPRNISRAMRLTFVSKYLERIADHATNIAEMVVYMVKGKIIRHMQS